MYILRGFILRKAYKIIKSSQVYPLSALFAPLSGGLKLGEVTEILKDIKAGRNGASLTGSQEAK